MDNKLKRYLQIMAAQQLLVMVILLGILIMLQRGGERQQAMIDSAIGTAIAKQATVSAEQSSISPEVLDRFGLNSDSIDPDANSLIPYGETSRLGANEPPIITAELLASPTRPPIIIQTPTPPPLTPTPTTEPLPTAIAATDPFSANVAVLINTSTNTHPINPDIYGISGGSQLYIDELQPTLNSWGGNPSTRYNWQLGNAWNAGHDWEYRNTDYGVKTGSAVDIFLRTNMEFEVPTRMVVPTLGWVAKDTRNESCSFIDENGACFTPAVIDCHNPPFVADPEATSVRSTPEDIRAWMQDLKAKNLRVKYITMDNEPMIWGFSHFDVHPTCTTYQEIADMYVEYAKVVKEEMPEALLTGPASCCWHFYWNSAAGPDDKELHENQDFMPWFLDQLRVYEEENGERLLDVLDIHYYPADLYQVGADDPEVAAHRLRAPAALWNGFYVDESWINQEVYIIPRMKKLIAEHYPGTKFGISEWNFGADDTMNGALALADVLGIYGKFGVDFANYWRFPEFRSAGFYAFKLYTNYDNAGGTFGDMSVSAESDNSLVPTYASLDSSTGNLHIMVINKQITESADISINLGDFSVSSDVVHQYRYAADETNNITYAAVGLKDNQHLDIKLPPYAVVHLVVQGK